MEDFLTQLTNRHSEFSVKNSGIPGAFCVKYEQHLPEVNYVNKSTMSYLSTNPHFALLSVSH